MVLNKGITKFTEYELRAKHVRHFCNIYVINKIYITNKIPVGLYTDNGSVTFK